MKHRILPKTITLVTFCLFLIQTASADPKKDIDTYLSNFIKEYNIAGLQVAVFDNQQTVFAKNYGAANPSKKISLQSNTLMFAASISKLITTELITKLAAEKKLKLNQPVVEHLPHLQDLSEHFQTLTIRHLLTHTSGLDDDSLKFSYLKARIKGRDSISILQRIQSIEKARFNTAPGTEWVYSDVNFDILGAIIEHINGQDFASVVDAEFFKPLSMRYSGYGRDNLSGFIFASSYKKRKRLPGKSEKEVFNPPYVNASNGLFSCVYDLVLWSQHQLKHSNQYIAWSPQHTINENQHMGLGWRVKQFAGQKVVYHYGGYKGFRHKLALFPRLNKGVIILSNDANMDNHRDTVFNELSRALIVPKT